MLQIKSYARNLSDSDIAERLRISRMTFYRWIKIYPQFKAAVDEGREFELPRVEEALKQTAIGYKVTLKKPIKLREEKQKQGEGRIVREYIEYVEEEIYIHPQPVAQIFYLKNRGNGLWTDKPKEIEDVVDDPLVALLNRIDSEAESYAEERADDSKQADV